MTATDKAISGICERINDLSRTAAARGRGGDGQVRIMEVCGTHTVAIARSGLRALLPRSLRLISGPGCPVCVTEESYVDRAVRLATEGLPGRGRPVIATYGDMVRVPGRKGSLAEARGQGAEVAVVYSADQAVELARGSPRKEVVFLAVGFETTSPGTAMAVKRAREEGARNFTVLTAHKVILPAMRALLSSGYVPIDGFLCPGHVSVILGWGAYEEIVRDFARPCVVAGFEARQILSGVEEVLRQLVEERPAAGTVYPCVSREGNPKAREVIDEALGPCDAAWRGLGVIPGSGVELREPFAEFDAARRFGLGEEDRSLPESAAAAGCRCADVICGRLDPPECPLFAKRCTTREPVGACMVSSEGACAAAYKYERRQRGGAPVQPRPDS